MNFTSRLPIRAACILLLVLTAGVAAQQPNTPAATLTINGAFAGPPFPIQVGGFENAVVSIGLSGAPSASGLPFLAAIGRIAPGSLSFPQGLVDLDPAAPGFGIVLNGFDPGFPFSAASVMGPNGQVTLSFFNLLAPGYPAGAQAVVSDPGSAAGSRLTAAADFAPVTNALLFVTTIAGSILGPPPLPTPGPVLMWSNNGGTVSPTPPCTGYVRLNSEIVIGFGGPVDPLSLPPPGPALGSITIQVTPGTVPAIGIFSVRDDPRLPAGNARLVAFTPVPPTGSSLCGSVGFVPGLAYAISTPLTGPSVVRVAGQNINVAINACFGIVPCIGVLSALFHDPAPGPPFGVSTIPASSAAIPAAIPSASIAGNTVSVVVSEALDPTTISLASFRLVNQNTGGQVPGAILFTQAGTGGLGSQSRLDYIAAQALPSGCVYRIEATSGIHDLVGNPIELVAGSPGSVRYFQTQATPLVPQPPIVENFASIATAAATNGPISWGAGNATALFDLDRLGDGSFGPLFILPNTITLNTDAPATTGFSNGVWHCTSLTVSVGANVRLTGTRRAHFRCLGAVTISGTLNGSAGNTSAGAALGSPEQGAQPGNFNNGTPLAFFWVPGGVGNCGGGAGGRASQADATGPPLRTPFGETGFGPPNNGAPNVGPYGADPTFGGGTGGQGGFLFPSGGLPGDVGALGAAGGSAFTAGRDGGPFTSIPTCAPLAVPSSQVRALASGIPAAMAAPISSASAGSGGGGGGDKFDPAGVSNDDQGGGGGAGGGGIRISSSQNVNIGASGFIVMDGGVGGNGNVFQGGHGGGGSGGEVWIQSYGQISINSNATLRVNPGLTPNACGNQGSGAGGVGLYQFEDSDGFVYSAFAGIPAGGANVFTLTLGNAGNVEATATSIWFSTGHDNPIFTTASVTLNNGVGAAGIVAEAAHATVGNANLPDPTTITAPSALSAINALSGHRFIRFRLLFAYPAATSPAASLPTVTNVTINFAL